MHLCKHRSGIYYLWFKGENGRRSKVSTRARHKPAALAFVKDFEKRRKEQGVHLRPITLTEFSTSFSAFSASRHTQKTQRSNGTALREFVRVAGNLRLDRVTPRDIETFLTVKRAEASVFTARKYHLALGAAFETARRWGHIERNPWREVPCPRIPDVEPCFFSREQFQRLLAVIENRELRELCLCAVSTGLRLGELVNLRWEQVDLETATLRIANTEDFTTKSKRNRSVPLNPFLRAMLLARRERSAGVPFVFHSEGKPLNPDSVTKAFKHCVRAAGLDDRLHFHSMRHAFASWLVQGGTSLVVVQKLLGHRDIQTTGIYAHLTANEYHSAVDQIAIVEPSQSIAPSHIPQEEHNEQHSQDVEVPSLV